MIYYPAEGPVGLVEFIMDPEQASDAEEFNQAALPDGEAAFEAEEAVSTAGGTPLGEDTNNAALSDGQEALLSDEPS